MANDTFKVDTVTLLLKVKRRTPLHKNRNALYMETVDVLHLETDTHDVVVNVSPMGSSGPVIQLKRKDEDDMARRHYSVDLGGIIEECLRLENSAGDLLTKKPKKVRK